MEKINVEHLTKTFGQTGVLHDVSFSVNDGEFLSILGPSGCGKTTILRILIGLETADSGKIIKDGKDITTAPSAQRRMGIVFQNYALFENMTVLKNVTYALINSATTKGKYNKAEAEKSAKEMLELVGLEAHLDKRDRLRGGIAPERWVRILMFPTPNRAYGYKRRWYMTTVPVTFEGVEFEGVTDAAGYLSFKFGDYMTLPPVSQRKVHPVSAIALPDDARRKSPAPGDK